VNRPRLLDAFCGAGGATRGYQLAGFHVTGVDIKPQPRYVGEAFHQADALEFIGEHGHEFDVIHASPPCQAFTALNSMWNSREHPDLLTPCRELLRSIGCPYVIENVPGAPMNDYLILCGTMFGLGTGDAELRRHRHFETNPAIYFRPMCNHGGRVIGVYGGHGRDRRRIRPATVGVYGSAGGRSVRDGTQQFSTDERREAMGIDWMSGAELSQAIPPAYTEYIGKQLRAALEWSAA
jgi:DNA (cytosine-5)-methyltransferase 1